MSPPPVFASESRPPAAEAEPDLSATLEAFRLLFYVLVKGFGLSYHNKETIFYYRTRAQFCSGLGQRRAFLVNSCSSLD